MMNYENVFRSGYTLFVRTRKDDGTLGIKEERAKPEFFKIDSNGKYTNIYNNKRYSIETENNPYLNDMYIRNGDPEHNYIRDNFGSNKQIPIRTWMLDIEVLSYNNEFPDAQIAKYPINMIQIYDTFNKKKVLFIREDKYISKVKSKKYDADIHYYNTEEALIKAFLFYYRDTKPTVITAWNGDNFDFPYIFKRIKNLLLDNKIDLNDLKIHKKIWIRELDEVDNIKQLIQGTYWIDMLLLYKYIKKKELNSYALDNVAKDELGTKKVEYTGTINNFYKTKTDIFIKYAIKDIEIMRDLEEKMNMFPLLQSLAYLYGINYDEAFGTIRSWESYLSNILFKENKFYYNPNEVHNFNYEGGYVREPIKGLHNYGFSIDFNSLYPSIINGFNIGFDTIIKDNKLPKEAEEILELVQDENEEKLMNKDILNKIEKVCKKYNMGFAGQAFFSNNKKSIIANEVNKIYSNRKIEKSKMLIAKTIYQNIKDYGNDINTEILNNIENGKITYKNLDKIDLKKYVLTNEVSKLEKFIENKHNIQYTLKIAINSLYGALANKYFKFFEPNAAKSITFMSRFHIKYVGEVLDKYMKNIYKTDESLILYGDTDSIYFSLDKLVQKLQYKNDKELVNKLLNFIDNYIQPQINDTVNEMKTKFNSFEIGFIGAKVEKIVKRFLLVSKKKYVLITKWDEGTYYKNEKKTIMGLDMIRTSTPLFCQKYLKDSIDIILKEDNDLLNNYIEEVKEQFMKADFDDLAKKSSVKELQCFYDVETNKYFRYKEDKGKIKKLSVPINTRAAWEHNKIIDKLNIEHEKIKPNQKIKFLYLKENNFAGNVIGYIDPKFIIETKLNEYIDYAIMFKKTFLQPLKLMTDSIGFDPNNEDIDLF